jgi:hypothetical protein
MINCDESPFLILHLAEAKCSLSPVAAVCVHSVECVEDDDRIDNTAKATGLSHRINKETHRNV